MTVLWVVKIAIGKSGIWNFIVAYELQVGCPTEEKDAFWRALESLLESIPLNERKIVLADLNGYVGDGNDGIAFIHGGFGFGTLNEQGNSILDFTILLF